MNKIRMCTLAAILLSGLASTAWAQDSPIQKRTQEFLTAYIAGDRQAVLGLVDHKNVTMYGSDVAEVAHGSDALLKLLDSDQKLWGGTARIGPMGHVSVVESRSLASMYFDVFFSVGGRPPLPLRMTAVWKREGGKWLLVQSSNAVVSEHQSADELLHPQ
jgi:SnoaL-like domain